MDHQDWTTYIVHCKEPDKATNKQKKIDNKEKKVNTGVLQKDNKLEKSIQEGKLKHKKIDTELSKKIQQGRLSKGLTQKQLANSLSIPITEINQMECGQFMYNGQKISKVKRFLGIK